MDELPVHVYYFFVNNIMLFLYSWVSLTAMYLYFLLRPYLLVLGLRFEAQYVYCVCGLDHGN